MSSLICTVKPCGAGAWHVVFQNAEPVVDLTECFPTQAGAENVAAEIMGSEEMSVDFAQDDGHIFLTFWNPDSTKNTFSARLEHMWPIINAALYDPWEFTPEDLGDTECTHGTDIGKFCDECAWGWVNENVDRRIPI